MARGKAFPQNKQTPSSKSSFSDPQLLVEARKAYHLAESNHQVALKKIRQLCEKHSNSSILFGAQAQILYICYHNLNSSAKKKKCLENALNSARRSIKFNPKSMVFSSFLAFLLYRTSTNAEECMEAFDEFNTSLTISDPTDPSEECPQSTFSETYEERIENVRKEILDHLEGFVLKLKELGVESSIIKLKLQSLNVEKKDKVKLYWISLSPNEKQNFLIVNVGDLNSSLVSSMKDSSEKILSEALSFYKAHKKWACWMCCSCNEIFPNFSLHFIHIVTTHMELLSKLEKVYPVRVSDWFPIINEMKWSPLDTSAAITMLEKKRELRSSKGNMCSNNENKTNVQETSTSEWDIYKWDWELSSDSNCMELLSMIQERLNELLLGGRLLATHMDILTQRAMSKFDGHFGGLLREFRVDRTHHCLCFLDASQLQEIHRLLQEMSVFTESASNAASASWREVSGNISILKDDSWATEINGEIYLSEDSLDLLLDEDSLCNESISGGSLKTCNYTHDSASATSDSPNVDNLITWIYSDQLSDQYLEKWRSLRAKKGHCGKEELVNYKNCLSEILTNLHEFQGRVSLAVIPTDVSDLEGSKDTGFALQKSQPDTSIQVTIRKKSENNDSELTKSDEQILRFAINMHQLEIILNYSATYSYQPIVLSIAKQYILEHMEGIMDKDPTKKSDTSIGKDLGTEEMSHPLEMKESIGASIGKDLVTEEVRHPFEMKESIGNVGASIDKDLGTEEVRHPFEMKESIGNVGASIDKDLGTEEVRHPLEMKESISASVDKGLGAEEVRLPTKMNESIVDPQMGHGNILSTRRGAFDDEGFNLAEVEEAMRLSLAEQEWETARGRSQRRTNRQNI